jgi:hypothetical protein
MATQQPTYPWSGFETVQGKRWSMEDAHVNIDSLHDEFPHIPAGGKASWWIEPVGRALAGV